MQSLRSVPGLRAGAIFIIALSLSIGWGIRGNFGHESGAMIAGVLASVAVCLMSGREDWRRRVPFFAFFGGLGWGFGGSISYMYPISFAGSEHWPSCIYGFLATFFIGLLWAGLGGMGTALAAEMDRKRLNDFLVPVLFVLATMTVSNLFVQPWLTDTIPVSGADRMDATWHRHLNPLYWFDADWFAACAALVGVCLFDLWDRRFDKGMRLIAFVCLAAVAGVLGYRLLDMLGVNARIAAALVIPLGDPTAINPETGHTFRADSFLTNWPNFVHYHPRHLGWLIGGSVGAGLYFWRYGTWRRDSKFILYLSCGWLIAFILMPTLGSIPLQSIGGFRLTPPRSDDWAGILGMFIAGILYCLRHKLGGTAMAASTTGIMGGFFFIFMPFLRALVRFPGHPYRTPGGTPEAWAHYQSANWHSVMEQLHGFGHGLALAVSMGLLAFMIKPHDDSNDRKRGLEIVAIAFVLFFITLMNVFKNVRDWTATGHNVVPELMRAPFFASLQFSASTWFLITWATLTLAIIALLIRHTRDPLPIVPTSWIGRGQLLYLAFLWIMVIANFERALVNFHENRLVTEWAIIINAALATFLIVALPRQSVDIAIRTPESYPLLVRGIWLKTVPVLAGVILIMAVVIRLLYGQAPLDSPQANHKRWGVEAQWRIRPMLKQGEHR